MISVECVAIFWVVNASSGEKSCLQFSIPTGSGAGEEGGVSHSLKWRLITEYYRENRESERDRNKMVRSIFCSVKSFIRKIGHTFCREVSVLTFLLRVANNLIIIAFCADEIVFENHFWLIPSLLINIDVIPSFIIGSNDYFNALYFYLKQ